MTDRFSQTDSLEFEVGGDRQDDLFAVLSHPRRRFVLQYLRNADAPTPVDELTTELVSWEGQRTVADGSWDDRDDVEISLVHSHLPKMAEAGVVRYDAPGRTVTLTDHTDEVRAHLQITTGD